jgi:hypothetical protein
MHSQLNFLVYFFLKIKAVNHGKKFREKPFSRNFLNENFCAKIFLKKFFFLNFCAKIFSSIFSLEFHEIYFARKLLRKLKSHEFSRKILKIKN